MRSVVHTSWNIWSNWMSSCVFHIFVSEYLSPIVGSEVLFWTRDIGSVGQVAKFQLLYTRYFQRPRYRNLESFVLLDMQLGSMQAYLFCHSWSGCLKMVIHEWLNKWNVNLFPLLKTEYTTIGLDPSQGSQTFHQDLDWVLVESSVAINQDSQNPVRISHRDSWNICAFKLLEKRISTLFALAITPLIFR